MKYLFLFLLLSICIAELRWEEMKSTSPELHEALLEHQRIQEERIGMLFQLFLPMSSEDRTQLLETITDQNKKSRFTNLILTLLIHDS